MKVYVNWVDFEIDIDKIESISFYYDSKRHKWIAYVGHGTGDEFEISEKKGEAIINFLRWLGQVSKKLSPPGSEETFARSMAKEPSTIGPGDEDSFALDLEKKSSTVGPGIEDNFDMVHDEEIFDFQGEVQ